MSPTRQSMEDIDESMGGMDESMEGKTDNGDDESNSTYYPWSEFFESDREETLESSLKIDSSPPQ